MRLLAFAIALATSLGLTSAARATVLLELSRGELVRRSDLIVQGTVVARWSDWDAGHSTIVTHTRLRVARTVRGTVAGEVEFDQPGGAVGDVRMDFAGNPGFAQGEEAVVCLRRGARGALYLTALSLGVYRIDRRAGAAPTVHRDLAGVSLAHPSGGRLVVFEPPPEPTSETLGHLLDDLESLSRGAAR